MAADAGMARVLRAHRGQESASGAELQESQPDRL